MSLGMQEILPDGGLASFQNHVSRIADLGRYEDAYIVHAAEGETVVPMAVFDENPRLKAMLFAQMRGMGIDPERYIVGNELNSINPVTGQPEFFLKKIFKGAKKALKAISPYAGLIAGAFGAGPYWSALAGGIGGLYGSEGDIGAGATGAMMGYGAGTAFGTAGWAGGDPTGGKGSYVFGNQYADAGGRFTGSLGRMGTNIGFGGQPGTTTTAGGKTIPSTSGGQTLSTAGGKVQASQVLTTNQAAALSVPEGTTFGELYQIGMIKNPAAPDAWYGKAMMALTAMGIGGEMLFGGDDKGDPIDWGPSHVPWGGDFAAPGVDYSAEGGIINAYDNGGPVDRHPGMDEGYGIGIEVDGEERDYRFDEQGMTNEARQAFLAREGITPIVGGIAGAGAGISEAMSEQVMRLASVLVEPGKRASSLDIERAMEMMKTMSPEEIGEFIFMKRRELLAGSAGIAGGSLEKANQFFKEGANEYTEDKYADGGIAHMANGAFPRMSGAIAGPGGPRDDMVPAMLSDGEFVMTADAVRNAGGGDRREGARRMYQLMNQLQGVA